MPADYRRSSLRAPHLSLGEAAVASTSPHPLLVTDRIAQLNELLVGRYVVQREIGAGGMATVYLAEDVKHHRKVAIKVLRDDISASVGGARFLREIEIAAQLQHPNILPLLDSGDADGLLYYVMPFVAGESLRQRLDREHELPVGDAVKLLIEIIDALAHAHEHGVVHRDIKPDNVMLSGRHALVTDFGVARAVSEAKGGTITTLGIALGTPAYMSPEQATADPAVDHRTDIYAVGVLAYELLAGRLPFSGSFQQMLAAHVLEIPDPVATHRPTVNAVLAQAVMRCLEKHPADRWQSAAELLAVLEPLATSSSGTAATEARIGAVTAVRSRVWTMVAGLVVVTALGVGTYWATRTRGPSLTLGKSSQFTTDAGLQINPALSPDGKFVAYAAGTSSNMRIYVRPIGGGRTIALTDDSSAVEYEPRWSPDGTQIMFLTRGGVSVAPALGGTARTVVQRVAPLSVSTASWSPDGRRIVFARTDSVLVANADGQSARLIFTSGDPLEGVHSCRWSPSGSLIACVSGNRRARVPGFMFANKAVSRIIVIPADGGTSVAISDARVQSQSPEWSSRGDRLFFISNRDGAFDVYEIAIDRSGKARGAPLRLTTGLNARSISFAASAPRVAYEVYTERSNIHSVPIPHSGMVQVTNADPVTTGAQVIEWHRVSRDGKWILYDSDRSGKSNIYRVPVGGGQPEQLTHESFDVFAPDLSPDGKLLAYHSWRNGNRDIEVRPLDGGPVEFVTTSPQQERYAVWSSDGRTLSFLSSQSGPIEGYVTRRLGAGKWSPPRRVVTKGASGGNWSPDGRHLVSVIARDVVIVPVDSGLSRTIYSAPDDRPRAEYCQYSVDGETVYCKSRDPQGRALILAIPASGGNARVIVSFPDLTRPSYRADLSVGAKAFYVVIQDRQSTVWLADVVR